MRHHQHCRGPRGIRHHVAQRHLVDRVKLRGRLVQQQQSWLAQERPRDRHPLTLATRQPAAAMPDVGVQPLGEPIDQLVEAGPPERLAHLGLGHVWCREPQVVADAARQHRRVLLHVSDRRPARPEGCPGCRARRAGSGPRSADRTARSTRTRWTSRRPTDPRTRSARHRAPRSSRVGAPGRDRPGSRR